MSRRRRRSGVGMWATDSLPHHQHPIPGRPHIHAPRERSYADPDRFPCHPVLISPRNRGNFNRQVQPVSRRHCVSIGRTHPLPLVLRAAHPCGQERVAQLQWGEAGDYVFAHHDQRENSHRV